MSRRIPTHYEVLGIRRDAKHNEVGLAYNRLMAARRKADAPPDLKAESRLREAYEVLGDLERRAAYDEQLRAARLKPAFGRNHAAFAALFVVAVGAGLFWYLRPHLVPELAEGPPPPGKPFQEILNGAIPAVGRLDVVDMSGQVRPYGVAFTVEEGVAVTSCRDLSPMAVLSVHLAPRKIPARVTHTDEALGLCRLEVPGAGGWPLSVSAVAPKPGDRVYATQLDARGEVALREGRVKSVKSEGRAAVVEVTVPMRPQHAGAPLLDAYGRVVAVANMTDAQKGYYVAIPASWGETQRPAPEPRPYQGGEEPAREESAKGRADEPDVPPRTRGKQEELADKIDPERRKRLEKAFRPPPSVPADL